MPDAHRARHRAAGRRRPWITALAMLALAFLLISGTAVWAATQRHDQAPTAQNETLILNEHFTGGTLDRSVWNTCYWWADSGCTIASNHELEWYVPGQVTVADGRLRLTAANRRVTGPDGRAYPYVSGMVTTGSASEGAPAKLAFRYGTVRVRFRIPGGHGLWPAIWLLPADQRSRPEIDLMEAVGQRPDRLALHVHPADRSAATLRHDVDLPAGSALSDGWHVVRLHWLADRLEFFLDGDKVWQVSGSAVPHERMYLVINLAVGGAYGGSPDPSAFPATFDIDSVRIWKAS